MFALLAEARKLSNPELEERVGFRLDGKERRKLNDLKLVDSDKPGRAYEHELSDAGWRWCADQRSAGPVGIGATGKRHASGERGASMERALYAILAGLGRYLRDCDQSLADIFRQRQAGQRYDDDSIESRIEFAYRALAPASGEFVKLRALRQEIADASRSDIDSALDQMYSRQRINLIPQSNQQALSAAERESAVRIGGEYKHLISIE